MTVANKPDHRGEYEGNRNTIARGMPGVSGVTVVTMLVCSFYFACEAAGASRARHSLRPLLKGGRLHAQSGRISAAGMRIAVLMSSDPRNAPHTQSSSPGLTGRSSIRGARGRTERPRRTGYPACAGYDGLGV